MAERTGYWQMLKQAVSDFFEDECPRLAAALAYYTIFSLPPLLILILTVVGAVVDTEQVRGALQEQIQTLTGPQAAAEITTIIENANRPGSGGVLATILGVAALLFGATGAFAQLQDALNRTWEVGPDPETGGAMSFLIKRVLSFGMILGVGFLLLVSLLLSAVLSAFGDALGSLVPGGLSHFVLQVIDLGLSLVVITLLFAAIFKVLPDAKIAWKDLWTGAIFTGVLFVLGKFLIGLYLGQSNPGEAFGAAGSLAVILVWIYYSGLILLLGAEFVQVWANERGDGIEPADGAVRLVIEKQPVRDGDAPRKTAAT